MQRLVNVLKAIFLAARITSAHTVKTAPGEEAPIENTAPVVEPPPPKEEVLSEYDPSQETEAIFSPLHGAFTEFYNIYCCADQQAFLEERCEFYLYNLRAEAVIASGASAELTVLFQFLSGSRSRQFLYRVYKVQGHLVLAANSVHKNPQYWYYATALELPEGRFNFRVAYLERPAKDNQQKQKEYRIDHGQIYRRGGAE